MNSKERLQRAVAYQKVDRVPVGLFGTHVEYEEGLADYIGVSSIEEMYKKLGIDIWHCKQGLDYTKGDNFWNISEEEGPPYADITSIEEVEAHQFADINDLDATALAQEIEEHQEFAVCGGINSAIFHHYLYVCGQENALCYLKTQPEVAKAIIRKITDFFVAYLEKVLQTGQGKIDLIENCNDFGTQRSLFISAEDFREFFKPQLQLLYDKAKEYGVFYMQHSCGAITPIIPDFIEMGADILNPIQTAASNMEIAKLVEQYYSKITFYGGIDTQHLLPHGPEAKIRKEVRKVLDLFGKDGGYILSGAQGLMEDIPYQHAVAMLEENLK
ncbi:MAG: uroporphyrinogen decarboxylase family protein [bacterium]